MYVSSIKVYLWPEKAVSFIPRLHPRKAEREPRSLDHLPSDIAGVVSCVVLIIELLLTQSDSKY